MLFSVTCSVSCVESVCGSQVSLLYFFPRPAAPHCRRWKRHAGLAAERQLEYLFLYAAHDQCIECLQFYAPHVNVACKSSGKDARASPSAEGTKAVSQDLEALFATWDL